MARLVGLWALLVLSWHAADGLPVATLAEGGAGPEGARGLLQGAVGRPSHVQEAEAGLREAARRLAVLAQQESAQLRPQQDAEFDAVELGESLGAPNTDVSNNNLPVPPKKAMASKKKAKFNKNAGNAFLSPKKLVETEENVKNARASFKGPHAEIKRAIYKKDKMVNQEVFGGRSERQVKVASIAEQEKKLAKAKATLAAQKPRVWPEIHPAPKPKVVAFGSNTTAPTPAPTPPPTVDKVKAKKAAKEMKAKKAEAAKMANKERAKKKKVAKLTKKAEAKIAKRKAAVKSKGKKAVNSRQKTKMMKVELGSPNTDVSNNNLPVPPKKAMASKKKAKFNKNAGNAFLSPKKLVETEENVKNARASFKGPHAEIKRAIYKKDKMVNQEVFGGRSERQVKVASIAEQEKKLAKAKATLAAQKPRVWPEIHPAPKPKVVAFGSNTTAPTPAPTPPPTVDKVKAKKAAKEMKAKKAEAAKMANKERAKKKKVAKLTKKAEAKIAKRKAAVKSKGKKAVNSRQKSKKTNEMDVMLGESSEVSAAPKFNGGETMAQEDAQEESLVVLDRNKSPAKLVADIDKLRSEASEARMRSRTAYMVNYIKHAPAEATSSLDKMKQDYIMQTYTQELVKHPEAATAIVKQVNAAVEQRKRPWVKKASPGQELGDSKEIHPPHVASGKTVAGMNKADNAAVDSKQRKTAAGLKKAMEAAAAAGNYIEAGKLQAQLQAAVVAGNKKATKKPKSEKATSSAAPKAAPKESKKAPATVVRKAPSKKAAQPKAAPPTKAAPKKAATKKAAPKKAATKKSEPQKPAPPQAQQPPVQSDVAIQAQRPPASQVAAAMAEFGPGGTYCKDCS